MVEIISLDFNSGLEIDRKAKQKLLNRYARADYLALMYPDQAAMKANSIVVDLLAKLTTGQIKIVEIDTRALLYVGGIKDNKEHQKMMVKGEEEYLKLQRFVSQIAGISLERIQAADEFWTEQLRKR